jgi:hypothetical protein
MPWRDSAVCTGAVLGIAAYAAVSENIRFALKSSTSLATPDFGITAPVHHGTCSSRHVP